MFSSSTYADRAPDRSYRRPALAHSQAALNYSTLGPGASTNAQQPLAASQLPPAWSSTFNPQNSLAASTRDGSGYLPGYLLSASQGMSLPEGVQRYEDPPLLPSKSLHVAPGTFGAETGDQHMSRQQPLDEDAPPTQSVLDELDTIPTNRDPFKTPARNRTHQRSTTNKEWHDVIVFGFPQDKISAAIKLFTSIGETQEPQPGPEGANWFKISYKHEWEAARAVRKNGELMNGQWMVGVKWAQDGKDGWATQSLYGPPAVIQNPEDETTSPTVTRPNPIGRQISLEPSSSAFRIHPGSTSAAAGAEDWASAHTAAATPGKQTKGLFGLVGW
ncbi:SubName: Full=Uncharacterized protein {ECO:0000313/EMBL:CCA66784.1} [Serendipita indica DSM 11827]|uniref:RRM Nup35-type domain-containing protein n=1 Tax=Serendipita indica (strain DSM 11827) TaxID=1109443 RepID=G4T5Z6_SERID|nr:SubName: Full=Uncharacterized protein {ECO:0000313/EMBL:CCA66784.1} [Serendipita indica DSM 11827]CCA66784.1 hypothetical protein PIIN_00464 [Serendipita indica DSM 11827]